MTEDSKEEKDGNEGMERRGYGTALRRSLRIALLAFLACLSFFFVLPLLAQSDIPRRIDARLNTLPFNRQLWGIALLDETGRLVYGRNQDRLFIPASNAKLVVSAVAA